MTNLSHPILSVIQMKFIRQGFQLYQDGSTAASKTFEVYSDTIGTSARQKYERQLDEGWDIEGLSPGFTGYKKLKEKDHPYALDAVNQETRTPASSTPIQYSTQNVKQGTS